MLETVDDDEKLLMNTRSNSTSARGSASTKWFLTEDGLYEVLMQSRRPLAKIFKAGIKRLIKDIRLGRYEPPENMDGSFTKLLEHLEVSGLTAEEDLAALNALRDDHNLPELTMEEYLENNKD